MKESGLLHSHLDEVRRKMIIDAVVDANGNNAKAARFLGISRTLVVEYLRRYRKEGYDIPRYKPLPDGGRSAYERRTPDILCEKQETDARG